MDRRTDLPLLLVLLRQTFILFASLERPPYFFPVRLPHLRQGSVLEGVRFDNPDGIKHLYRIGIVPIAFAVLLVPVLAVIFLLAIIDPAPFLFRLWLWVL